jgi:hypothetical protein
MRFLPLGFAKVLPADRDAQRRREPFMLFTLDKVNDIYGLRFGLLLFQHCESRPNPENLRLFPGRVAGFSDKDCFLISKSRRTCADNSHHTVFNRFLTRWFSTKFTGNKVEVEAREIPNSIFSRNFILLPQIYCQLNRLSSHFRD